MKKIETSKALYALQVSPNEDSGEVGITKWFGKSDFPLQTSVMRYDAGKVFRTHQHKLNPRLINRTQEAFVVVRGRIHVDIYTTVKAEADACEWMPNDGFGNIGPWHLGTLSAGPGDAIFVWRGFHKISVIENDSLFYEIKAGQLTSMATIEDEKDFLDVP